MKNTNTSTADFVVTFWNKSPMTELEKAFLETQKHISSAKTQIELEVIEGFVIHFFEGFPEKRQLLNNQIHYRMVKKISFIKK